MVYRGQVDTIAIREAELLKEAEERNLLDAEVLPEREEIWANVKEALDVYL